MTDWTVTPPATTPTAPAGTGPPLWWEGTTPGGAPGVTRDPNDPTLTGLHPVYPAQPGQQPTYGGGGETGAGTTTWTVTPPPAAPTTGATTLPGGIPPPPPVLAPPTAQAPPAGMVAAPGGMRAPAPAAPPDIPQLQPLPPPVSGLPRGAPAAPPPLPQLPGQPPPAPVQQLAPPHQYTLPGATAPIPTSITHPMDVFGSAFGSGLVNILGPLELDLMNQGLRYAGIGGYTPWALTSGVNRVFDPTGANAPTTPSEQWIANVGANVGAAIPTLPFAVAGLTGKALQAALLREGAGALGAGSGQTLAEQVGVGPAGQFAAALLGGMGGRGIYNLSRGTGAAISTGTQAGREALAGQALAAASSSPTTLATRLATPAARGLPTAERTTAMAAGADPGLALVEHAAYATPRGGPALRAVEAQRNQAIAEALTGLRTSPLPRTAAERGASIRGGINAMERTMSRRVDQLYDAARAAPGAADMRPVLPDIARITSERFGPGGAPAPSAWRRITGEITARSERAPVNAQWLMNMDRQLGDEARAAGMAGNRTAAGAYRQLQTALEKLSPNPAYDVAKRYRAQVGRVLGRDATGSHVVGDLRGTDAYGMPRVPDDRVVQRIFTQGPGAVRQLLDASDEAIRAARASGDSVGVMNMRAAQSQLVSHLRESFIDGAERQRTAAPTPAMTAGGVSTVSPTFSHAKWQTFWTKNEGIAQQLFEHHEITTLRQIGDQLSETASLAMASKAKGSDTAQILMAAGKGKDASLAHVFGAASGGRTVPGTFGYGLMKGLINKLPLAIGYGTHGVMGAAVTHFLGADHLTDIIFKRSDEAINALVQDAAADPAIARRLVQRASERGLLDVANLSRARQGRFWQFLQNAATAASAAASGASRPALP